MPGRRERPKLNNQGNIPPRFSGKRSLACEAQPSQVSVNQHDTDVPCLPELPYLLCEDASWPSAKLN